MNNQISNKDGKFKYPDGVYYRLGEAPAQWSINDRETSCVVFLEDNPRSDKKQKISYDELQNLSDNLAKNALANRKTPELALKYARDNFGNVMKQYNVIGKLSKEQMSLLGTNSGKIRLSVDTLVKNKINHPEITNKMYGELAKNAKKWDFIQDKTSSNAINFKGEINKQNYKMVIKTTAKQDENYLTSFRLNEH